MSGFGSLFGGLFSRTPKSPAPAEPVKPAPVEPPKPEAPKAEPDYLLQLIKEAKSWIGVKEQGSNRGEKVQQLQRTVSGSVRNGHGSAESESWCMSAVQSWVWEIEKFYGIKSPVYASEHCLTVWSHSPESIKSHKPFPGAIVIWQHGKSSNGHTGIVSSVLDAATFSSIEGNTGPSDALGEVVRNGDGVYEKRRSVYGAGEMKVVGFIRPF